jgi:S1-C subfamily serine protease
VARQQPAASPLPNVDRSGKTAGLKLTLFDGSELRAQEVFALASEAVYVVDAGEIQGSAVAINGRELLTNCHVVRSHPTVSIAHEGVQQSARLVTANLSEDRCVLTVERPLAKWVKVRPYADVKIGERTYSIGSPKGLELSMAEGIVSSKRTVDGGRLIQTTAPISPGSSGGGLFDAQGNLIGITTFMLKDSQNLNFAIAAEEYAK